MTDSVAVFEPGFRVLDTNGNPVNNAKIKFREIGPGATKVVYSDAALTVPLGTIVRTRSDGFPVVSVGSSTTVLIYVGNTNYNIEITDEFDVPIFPAKDVVKGAVDTSGFLTTGSTSVLVKPVITKAVPFTLALADKGKLYDCIATGGTFTGTLPDPTTVGDGWNITIRNGGTANLVSLSSPANVNTPMGDLTAFSLRVGEAMEIVSNGATFKVDSYTPPLISATTGVILIADRVSAAPGAPLAGSRYIVTAAFSTFNLGDIIEANGQGAFFKITPPADCGWLAWVTDEDRYFSFQNSAWVLLLAEMATQADMEADSSLVTVVPPGRVKFNPGVAKWWAYITGGGTPVLTASHNVTSITDQGVGLCDVTIATDYSSANWVGVATVENADGDLATGEAAGVFTTSKTAGGIRLCGEDGDEDAASNDLADWFACSVIGFGDQA